MSRSLKPTTLDEHAPGPRQSVTTWQTEIPVPTQRKSESWYSRHDGSDKVKPRKGATHVQEPLPFEKTAAVTPTNPALHSIRQANPNLNEYQFSHKSTQFGHRIDVSASGEKIGRMQWADDKDAPSPDFYHERNNKNAVSEIRVHPAHEGKGVASGMWDYANRHPDFAQATPNHSRDRSMAGNAFAHFVGGATPYRTDGYNVKHYGWTER